jgi:alkanesulfonate monooxygenase SsuD/methylene tetrahydromethanopterin reductase-like flavin-dependent oxidoreductase (luciferase family)
MVHLAVALDGAGWHPAAWREPRARPDELLTAAYWADLVAEAERGQLDFVTIEDALSLQSSRLRPDGRQDLVRGRLDAVLIAARIAPLTKHIGLVPTVNVTHTEPFHISKAIATLDYVSGGRAGWRPQISSRKHEADHFGRREIPAFRFSERDQPPISDLIADLFDEAAEFVEVVRRLWDSWEDDAEIRDAATGRFVDRDKLHYIDFVGKYFSVKGPSITPRPPQGQPVIAALAHSSVPYQFAARSADIVFVTPSDVSNIPELPNRHVFGELVVFLDPEPGRAAERRKRLDAIAPLRSDALVFAGTAAELANLLADWHRAGLTGFRLRPGAIPDDLEAITRQLVPELQVRGLFRRSYEESTLRDRLGLPRPANRYAGKG